MVISGAHGSLKNLNISGWQLRLKKQEYGHADIVLV